MPVNNFRHKDLAEFVPVVAPIDHRFLAILVQPQLGLRSTHLTSSPTAAESDTTAGIRLGRRNLGAFVTDTSKLKSVWKSSIFVKLKLN